MEKLISLQEEICLNFFYVQILYCMHYWYDMILSIVLTISHSNVEYKALWSLIYRVFSCLLVDFLSYSNYLFLGFFKGYSISSHFDIKPSSIKTIHGLYSKTKVIQIIWFLIYFIKAVLIGYSNELSIL